MAKEKVDFKGRRDDSPESKEEEDGLSLIETLEDKEPEVKELEISDFTYGIKIYFIILAYVLILMILTLFLPTSIAFILWILAGVGIYKGFETYGEDKPWFSELLEKIQNFGFSSTKEDDWGEGEVEDLDGETIEEENTLSFENYAEKFDEWRVTKDTVSAPFISAGDKISKFSFNSDGWYKFRLWLFLIVVPILIWWIGMLWIVSLPFYAWYNILGFNSFQAENLSKVSALFLSSFIIIRIYSHCTNNRNLPLNSDLFSDYDPFVVKHLFKWPREGSSPIIFKAMLLDFLIGWLIILPLIGVATFEGIACSPLLNQVDLDYVSILTLMLYVAVLTPIVEELVFRGFVLDLASETYGKWTSIVISSVLFALIHINAISIINAFFGGLIYGYVRVKTNSLWPSIFLHSAWNAHLYLIAIFCV